MHTQILETFGGLTNLVIDRRPVTPIYVYRSGLTASDDTWYSAWTCEPGYSDVEVRRAPLEGSTANLDVVLATAWTHADAFGRIQDGFGPDVQIDASLDVLCTHP